MYKYDLGQTLIMYVVIVTFCKVSCIARVYRDNVRERVRERERKRGRCLYDNRRVWRRRGARGHCLCASHCCNLTLIVDFCSSWTAVVFPNLGFPR